jgi:hypothetical protein
MMTRILVISLSLTLAIVVATVFVSEIGLIRAHNSDTSIPRHRNRVIFVPGICSTGPVGTAENPNTFWEMYRWLADELEYDTFQDSGEPADIYGFSYETPSTIETDPEKISYDPIFTKLSISEVHASGLRLMILSLAARYPGYRRGQGVCLICPLGLLIFGRATPSAR